MLEFLKVILLGIVEGITEWLPISSTGHLILVDEFIKLNADKDVAPYILYRYKWAFDLKELRDKISSFSRDIDSGYLNKIKEKYPAFFRGDIDKFYKLYEALGGNGQAKEYYDKTILTKIILRSARLLNVQCNSDAASEIALRSRGTPRIANALLRRVRDFAQVKGDGTINLSIAHFALEALNIDQFGLDEIDHKILLTLIDKFKGGPVGLSTIATALSEDSGTLEEVYEPYLIQKGLIARTPRGRIATDKAYK